MKTMVVDLVPAIPTDAPAKQCEKPYCRNMNYLFLFKSYFRQEKVNFTVAAQRPNIV